MSKTPDKGGTEKLSIPTIKLPPGKPHQTRATTLAASSTKATPLQSANPIVTKEAQGSKGKAAESDRGATHTSNTQAPSALQLIAEALNTIIAKEKPERRIKSLLEGVLIFIRDTEERELKEVAESARGHPEVSSLQKTLKQDLSKLHAALSKQLDGILGTASVTLENTEKTLADIQNMKEATNEISSKVGKVNEAADKIATTTQSYRDALTQNPVTANKSSLDPKVLGDMERRARQILVDIHDEDGNDTLAKSLTELIAKANETIGKIEDADKPEKVLVESALQTRKGGLVLTLNSKEAASWLRQTEHEMAFTEGFSKGSHIRERCYNLILPRVPIVFEPENRSHLREIEEANNLREHVIRKARWIKPVVRRRPGQTHAFAILTVTSAEYANILIRDGLLVCGARVRPTKQKLEPIQCMKCRNWGHFAGECPASVDTCGTCGGKHRTNSCQNRDKRWCVTCESADHASWDRNCPEFSRRCYMLDERNPENHMPYFPTEQDWSQMTCPDRITLDECFPGRYAVNSLPIYGTRQPNMGPREPRERSNAPPPRNASKRGNWHTEKVERTFPNTIPIDRDNRPHAGRPDKVAAHDLPEQPSWMEGVKEQLTSKLFTNDGQDALGAGNNF
jgi:uncharacterized protein YoxC